MLMLWGGYVMWGGGGLWHSLLGTVLWIGGILRLPRWFAWRITADSEGLWFNGLRGIRHIAWDDLRKVECAGTELTLGSRQAAFSQWSAHAPRRPWLERRFGLLHGAGRGGDGGPRVPPVGRCPGTAKGCPWNRGHPFAVVGGLRCRRLRTGPA
ncbi:hypothetical protein [Streptomyces sp. NPDC059468]|uniref:hypothetical protein n=1 Tax=Streptomyces sp. NPDC059468 TaxID=3346845 RepID=UPI00368E3C89